MTPTVRTRLVAARAILLLGCLLARHEAVAGPQGASIFFHATSLPVQDGGADLLSDAGQRASFAAFEPGADAATISALIASLEDSQDYFSPAIAEHSAELGKVLQAEGRHEAALAAFERSLQILRRHHGLHSQEQTAVLQAMIDSHIALSRLDESDTLHQALLSMQRQVLAGDAPALAEAHAVWADWNVQYYLQARQETVFGGRSSAQEAALAQRLGQALLDYHRALALLAPSDSPEHYEQKIALERRIAALTLMANRKYQDEQPSMVTKTGQYSLAQRKRSNHPLLAQHGGEALRRALSYSQAGAGPERVAERLLELGDWHLLLNERKEAYAAYRSALSSMREAGLAQERIGAIVDSGLPVRNPEHALQSLLRDDDSGEFDGYVDVALEVDPWGRARNPRVLAGEAHDSLVEGELLERIRAERFRPAVEQDAGRSQEVMLRYYFMR